VGVSVSFLENRVPWNKNAQTFSNYAPTHGHLVVQGVEEEHRTMVLS
jgi:hypothetical protein